MLLPLHRLLPSLKSAAVPSNPLLTFRLRLSSRLRLLPFSSSANPSVPSHVVDRLNSLSVPSFLHPHVSVALSQSGLSSKGALESFPDEGLKQIVESIKATSNVDLSSPPVNVHFSTSSGSEFSVSGYVGESVLDMAKRDVVLSEYLVGSCGGTMSCSTCHVYLSPEAYARRESGGGGVSEEEMDMLDLAKGYEEGRSRLGCAVNVEEDGMEVQLPEGYNDYWS